MNSSKQDYLDKLLDNILYLRGSQLEEVLFILEVNNPVFYAAKAGVRVS